MAGATASKVDCVDIHMHVLDDVTLKDGPLTRMTMAIAMLLFALGQHVGNGLMMAM